MTTTHKVLLLDDEAIVCERLAAALEKSGFAVETFQESQRALERLAEERFDVVVTDLKMRGPDGLEVLNFVTANCPHTRVIIITGFATVDTAKAALKGGAVDFIAKPFRISRLRDMILDLTTGSQQSATAQDALPR